MISRSVLLGAGLGATLTGVLGWAGRAAAAESVQVWGLDPNWGGDPGACGCGSCVACRSHAANKLFASAAAADGGRAHAYCKCLVVALTQLERSTYDALFLDGGARASVDRRSQWVQAVLVRTPVNASMQAAAPSAPPSPATPADSLRAGSDEAALRRVWVARNASKQRVVNLEIDSPQPVTASLLLSREGVSLARHRSAGFTGSRRIKLAIPRHALAGPATLSLELTNAAERTTRTTRGIYIPRRY